MKNTIKSITLTIEELRQMLADTVQTGTTSAADKVIRKKIAEKSERLRIQREKRRLRKEQQAKEKSETKNETTSNPIPATSDPKQLTIALNKALATCILWINNRRDHLKNNILRLIHELSRYTTSPLLANLESALNTLLHLTHQAAIPAHQHLHLTPHRLRPTSLTLTL